MAQITVQEVITRSLERADLAKSGASGFMSPTEMLRLTQLGLAQLQNMIINTYEYWIKSFTTFNTITNQVSYSFDQIGASDLYKPLGIGLIQSVDQPFESWTPLEHWNMDNQNLPASGFIQFTNGYYTDMRYLFMADRLELRPVKAVCAVGLYYVPTAPQLASPADLLPYWCKPGWEEYLVAFNAWMIAGKEQAGTEVQMQIWNMISEQIKNFAPNRDQFKPFTVQDSWRSRNASNDMGGGFYGAY